LNGSWAGQNVTIVPGENSQILGVTVTNPNTRGTGIWIETDATVRNSTLRNNNRDGIAIVGSAKPIIANNRFLENTGNGIFISNEASGEIRDNEFRNTGYGMAIDNRSGIVITKSARPILSRNRIENNEDHSIIVIGQSQPVLEDNTLIGNGNDRMVMGIPQGNPSQPSVVTANGPTTQFGCMQSGDDLAMTVQQGKKTLPKIIYLWTGEHQGANFCQTLTESLNNIVADKDNSFNDVLEKVIRNLNQTRRSTSGEENLLDEDRPQDQININLPDLNETWESDPGLWFMDQ